MPLRWTELRDFAFSEDGFSNCHGSSSSSSNAAATKDSAGGGSSSKAATAVAAADGDKIGAGAGGAKAGGGGVKEMPKRWDQPFHHTVPPFPMPRKRRNPWAEGGAEGQVAGEGASGGGGEENKPIRAGPRGKYTQDVVLLDG